MAFVHTRSASSDSTRLFRILIASQYALVRDTVEAVIAGRANMEVVGRASDARTAITLSCRFDPAVLVLDTTIFHPYGPNIGAQVKRLCSSTRILVLSDLTQPTYPAELLHLGVAGCVSGQSAPHTLFCAIEAVGRRRIYLDPALLSPQGTRQGVLTARPDSAAFDSPLSEQEQRILRRIAHGYSGKEIATHLNISVKTVETYKARAMGKLNIHSRVGIVSHAIRQGWFK